MNTQQTARKAPKNGRRTRPATVPTDTTVVSGFDTARTADDLERIGRACLDAAAILRGEGVVRV